MAMFLVAIPAVAHHSPARFLEDQIVAVHGRVLRLDWKNPHVYLVVEDDKGVEWLFETNATSNLTRLGWSRDSFVNGDVVTVRALANRDPDKTHAMLLSAVAANGTTYSTRVARLNAGVNGANESADSLGGVWQGDAELAFKLLFGVINHPTTDKAEAARARYDESMDPITECITWPTPRLVAWGAFYLLEFDVSDSVVLMRSEFDRLERVIYMDGREHPVDGERTSQGHSIGWWEDDTLVVDTRLFADSVSPVADGIPSGAQKHVVERYTLTDDGRRIDVGIFLEDPEYLAEPFSATLLLNYLPNQEMLSFDCDPAVSKRFIQ